MTSIDVLYAEIKKNPPDVLALGQKEFAFLCSKLRASMYARQDDPMIGVENSFIWGGIKVVKMEVCAKEGNPLPDNSNSWYENPSAFEKKFMHDDVQDALSYPHMIHNHKTRYP